MNTQSRLDFWKTHIERWEKSGQTQRLYCQNHKLNLKSFTSRKTSIKKSMASQPKEKKFIALKEVVSNPIKIKLSNGMELTFDEIPSPIWFGKLISEINENNV